MFDARFLEEEIGAKLGLPVLISLAQEPIEYEALGSDEKTIYGHLHGSPRLHSWLRGRAALKSLLSRIGEDTDTGRLRFPHRSLSLTHCGARAVAAAIPSPSASGLGIDLEHSRALKLDSARFFLNGKERDRICDLPSASQSLDLLRLWTVKEAVFKANPENRGTLLGHYELIDVEALVGHASWRGDESIRYRYGTLVLEDGFLTIALRT